MAILEKNIQDEIDYLIDEGNELWESDRSSYYELLLKAWNLYPEPKSNWNEAYSLAKEIFDSYIIEGNLSDAKKWLNEMINHNNNLHLMDFDISFNIGKYHFENREYQKVYDEWTRLVSQKGFRYFDNQDPKYLDFYKNPEKYIKE